MAGKDGGEEIIKQGFMVKRSQNKKRFSPINYKQRWFVLTRRHLIYYDSEGEVSSLFFFYHEGDGFGNLEYQASSYYTPFQVRYLITYSYVCKQISSRQF